MPGDSCSPDSIIDEEGPIVAESRHPTPLDGSPSVSALGLRWAALRGMLSSPLIDAEEQRALREELLRELQSVEQDFAGLPARSTVEISAKIDVVKTALRQEQAEAHAWLADLLESVQADLRSGAPKPTSSRQERPPTNLTRAFQNRAEPSAAASGASGEGDQPAVA
jgi:hypothetical protein